MDCGVRIAESEIRNRTLIHNPQSAINPPSEIRNPQLIRTPRSAIRNTMSSATAVLNAAPPMIRGR